MGKKQLDNMTVLMTTVTTNQPDHPPRYILLRIVDETSGQHVAEVEIMPQDLIQFLGNSTAKARGWVNDASHRFGREHQWHTYKIDGIDGYGPKPEHHNVLAAIAQSQDDGWETYDYRFSHGEHTLVCRRWVEIQEDDDES